MAARLPIMRKVWGSAALKARDMMASALQLGLNW
jgi:hypothetical protein